MHTHTHRTQQNMKMKTRKTTEHVHLNITGIPVLKRDTQTKRHTCILLLRECNAIDFCVVKKTL